MATHSNILTWEIPQTEEPAGHEEQDVTEATQHASDHPKLLPLGRFVHGPGYFCFCMHAQLCPILCSPMDCSPPGSSVHGISQARILEWVAIPFSMGSSQPRDRAHVSYISCTGRRVLHHQCHLRSHLKLFLSCLFMLISSCTTSRNVRVPSRKSVAKLNKGVNQFAGVTDKKLHFKSGHLSILCE